MTRRPEVLLWSGGYSAGMEGTAEGIGLLNWDGSALTFERTVGRMPSPSFLAYDDGVLAAVDEETGRACTFGAAASGDLTALGHGSGVATSGPNPCHVRFVRVGGERMLLLTNYGGGTIDLVSLAADGAVQSLVASFPGQGSGPRPEQDAPHAHSTVVLPSSADGEGAIVLAADLGADTVYSLSLSREGLERRSSLALPPGTGPRDLLVVGGRVLLLGEFGGPLFELAVDLRSPEHPLSIVASGHVASAAESDQASGLVSGPDARFLYAGLRGSNRIAVVDAATLEPVGETSCGGDWPRHLAVVGDLLFVSNQRSGTVSVFALDDESGLPSLVTRAEVPTPTCLLPVPQHVS